ncbi:MAG: hypothetical protein IJK91_07965 [Bacteroidales bacterium]|nr:hypothetical protein [Bacteroidales bacterium]
MNYKRVPELQSLLDAVEKKYGAPLLSTNDFNVLSALLKFEGRETLSASTLKRLWHYVSQETTPRKATLDVLARFVGYKDFRDYRLSLLGEATESSGLLDAYTLPAEDIADGGIVIIGWEPNRLVRLRKAGDDQFEVVESLNSKLREGDRLQCSFFFKGLPLVVPWVERGGQRLPSYIAGKAKGLNLVKTDG